MHHYEQFKFVFSNEKYKTVLEQQKLFLKMIWLSWHQGEWDINRIFYNNFFKLEIKIGKVMAGMI